MFDRKSCHNQFKRRWEDRLVWLCKASQKNIATTNEKHRTKGLKEYDKTVAKHEEAEQYPKKRLEALRKAPEAKTVKNARTGLREKIKASAVSRLIRKAREHGFRKTNSYLVGYMYFTTADRDGNPDKDNDEKNQENSK